MRDRWIEGKTSCERYGCGRGTTTAFRDVSNVMHREHVIFNKMQTRSRYMDLFLFVYARWHWFGRSISAASCGE